MARLFTVCVSAHVIPHVGRDFAGQQVFECDFVGMRFSRQCESDLIRWVRISAKRRFGQDTQVIFLHIEGLDQ
jgi:hypothetical protein